MKIEYLLDQGFVWLLDENKNCVFILSLSRRKKGLGYKKEISKSNNGHDCDFCGYINGEDDLNKRLKEFLTLARKSGFKIVE